MNFRYKSGIQAGLGVYTDRDNWDAYVEYTWLSGHQRVNANAPPMARSFLFGAIRPISMTSVISSGKCRWKLELNIIDAQLARSYFVGTKLTFRPFFAGRAAWINQKYSARLLPESTNVPLSCSQLFALLGPWA